MKCSICGEELQRLPNPNGPEVFCDLDGTNYGCVQAAFNLGGDEDSVPYPPHVPEEDGISEPGLQAQFDAQQEMMKE